MPGRVFRILWGTNQENVLDFNYPAVGDAPRFWREPRPGSESFRANDVQDSWITGYYYYGKISARWFGWGMPTIATPLVTGAQSQWAGSTGLQAFLAWAAQSNAFTWVPDAVGAPLFKIPGCYLMEPFMDGEPTLEPDISQTIDLKFWNPSMDLALAYRGLMFEYAPGADISALGLNMTVTRASAGWYVGADGLYHQVANDTLRDRHYGSVSSGSARTTEKQLAGGNRSALLEQSTTNLLDNGDFETDAVGTAATASATIARDSTYAFNGTQSMKVITANLDDSGVSLKLRNGNRIAVTAGNGYTLSGWVYCEPGSAGKKIRLVIDWWNVTPALISSTVSADLTLTSTGWQRWTMFGTAPGGAVTAQAKFSTNGPQTVFTYWLDVVQFENSAYATSAIPTTTAAVTRQVDLFRTPVGAFPWDQQEFFAYALLDDYGFSTGNTFTTATAVPLQIGSSTSFTDRYTIEGASGGVVSVNHFTDLGNVSASVSTGVVEGAGQALEIMLLGFADGSVQMRLSANGGADAVSSQSAAIAGWPGWPSRHWSVASVLVQLGALGTNAGVVGLRLVKIGPRIMGGMTFDTIAKARAA